MTDWVRDTLSHIINNRYNERRVTIFTSNLDDETSRTALADERVREKPNLRAQIGDALRSRLYEMCEVIRLDGEDYRRTVKHIGRRGGPLHRQRQGVEAGPVGQRGGMQAHVLRLQGHQVGHPGHRDKRED